jgi:LDH2 family malate/lactate/ureidoglycolate dehydrogenase
VTPPAPAPARVVRVDEAELIRFVGEVFGRRGVPGGRARAAADALCYGDRTGHASHGVANLSRLYLPLFEAGRVDPVGEPRIVTDRGAAVLLDARRALGLWAASEAMDLAVARAANHGIGMVSVHSATHFGCAGYHAARAAACGMVGIVASNCGGQRIARPPGGRLAMLGTNPLSVAAPAGGEHPFVLDMSTTAVPTGRVRAAARAGETIPEGWLEDDAGAPVTDPAAFDRGDAHLIWLGGTGQAAYKGFGLGLAVEVLAALVSGAALGPDASALEGDGGPSGRDDDIGLVFIAIAPSTLRPDEDVRSQAQGLFGSLLACPPVDAAAPVRYPGWHEAERASESRRDGVGLDGALYDELVEIAGSLGLSPPGWSPA